MAKSRKEVEKVWVTFSRPTKWDGEHREIGEQLQVTKSDAVQLVAMNKALEGKHVIGKTSTKKSRGGGNTSSGKNAGDRKPPEGGGDKDGDDKGDKS